jgi:hypothetical protein
MSQFGYGNADPVGAPFTYDAGVNGVVTGSTITMVPASLVLNGSAVAALAVVLPLNPPDGCVAEITNVGGTITAFSVAANTGDLILAGGLGAPTIFTAASASTTAPSAANTYKYKYTLNGYVNGNVPALNPRTWIRVQ